MNSSNYVYGSHLSYLDFIQGQLYIEDVKKNNKSLAMDISKQTRQLIASNESLAQMHIEARNIETYRQRDFQIEILEQQNEVIQQIQEQADARVESITERLSYSISDLSDNVAKGLTAFGAKFQWCCSQMIS
ncbi:MAG: hypothetical protein RBS43_01860, partial [Candidatus Cloacimonas sp.]|nr:hypothetical protein [Candidatus Cloacimonas sp.]